MTNLQLFGIAGVMWLFDDLVRWIRLPRVSDSRRAWQVRHALFGLAGPVYCGGVWVLFTMQEGTHQGPPAPWCLTLLAAVLALAFLGRVLLELRCTIRMLREGA